MIGCGLCLVLLVVILPVRFWMVMFPLLGLFGRLLLRLLWLMLTVFSGGPVPDRGLVLGRGAARFRVVRLGGPKVRKVCGSAVDPADGGDVHLYRDSSLAPLLDLRRRLKVVF